MPPRILSSTNGPYAKELYDLFLVEKNTTELPVTNCIKRFPKNRERVCILIDLSFNYFVLYVRLWRFYTMTSKSHGLPSKTESPALQATINVTLNWQIS